MPKSAAQLFTKQTSIAPILVLSNEIPSNILRYPGAAKRQDIRKMSLLAHGVTGFAK